MNKLPDRVTIDIAIDESNHGRFPEIFVSVPSKNPSDTSFSSEQLGKQRAIKDTSLHRILKGRDFRYVLVPREFKDEFGVRGIYVIVLSEFIKHFTRISQGNLETVLVDGQLHHETIEQIGRLLYPMDVPEIKPLIKGDQWVPLINMADATAHYLFEHFTSYASTKRQYRRKMIKLKKEDYGRLREK